MITTSQFLFTKLSSDLEIEKRKLAKFRTTQIVYHIIIIYTIPTKTENSIFTSSQLKICLEIKF